MAIRSEAQLLLFISDNLSRWCLPWIQSACPHIQMSALIAEPKLEGQTVAFSHTNPMGCNLIKIHTHSAASPYTIQVVFTVCVALYSLFYSLCLLAPNTCFTYPQCFLSTSINVRLLICWNGCMSVCWHTWVRGPRLMSCTHLPGTNHYMVRKWFI